MEVREMHSLHQFMKGQTYFGIRGAKRKFGP